MKDNEKASLKQVIDGLYIGDVDSSSNLNGLLKNRIYNVVNCASRELANTFEDLGVKYLNFYWEDSENQLILDDRDVNLNLFENFLEQAHSKRQNVAVVSYQGRCRSCVIVTAYMMRKFQWPLFQTLEFLDAKHEGLMLRQNFLQQLRELEDRLYPGQVKKPVSWKPPETSTMFQQSISTLAKSSSPMTTSNKNIHPILQIDNVEPVSNTSNPEIMTFRMNSNDPDNVTLGPEDSDYQKNTPVPDENMIRTRTVSFGKNSFKSSPSKDDLILEDSQLTNQIKANSEPSNKSITNPFLVNNGVGGQGVSPRFNDNNIFHQALKANMQIKPNPYPGPRVLFGGPEEVKPQDDDIKVFRHTNRGQMFNEWYKTRDTFYNSKRKETNSSQSPPSKNEIDYFRATRANAFRELEDQQQMKNKLKAMSSSPGAEMDRSYMSRNSDAQSVNSAKYSSQGRQPLIEDESYNELIQAQLTQNQFRDRRKPNGYNRVQHRKIVGRMMNERKYDTEQKRTIDFYGTPLRSNYIESAPAKNPSTDSSFLETPSNKKKVNFTLDTGSSKALNDSIFSGKANMRTIGYEPRPPSEIKKTATIENREVPGYPGYHSGYNSVSPPRERLPVISSPNKQPVTQVRMKSLYQNPDHYSHLKNSTYGKLGEDPTPKPPPEKNHGNILNGTQMAKNAALKKKYEEMQYLENLFMKKDVNEPPKVETPRKEDFKNLIGTLYQKNFPGFNIS